MRIPPGTPSGRTLRIPGHGAPAQTGRGDLYVTVEIAVPQRLTDAERQAIRRLADAMDTDPRRPLH